MTDPSGNGQVAVNAHVVNPQSGTSIRFTAANGAYLGSITFDAVNREALGVIGNMFQQWCSQQAGGIQVAGAGTLNGLRQ